MSLEHSPTRSVAGIGHNSGDPAQIDPPQPLAQPDDFDYWHALIDEKEAAAFYDVTVRTLQKWRQTGGGPPFIRFSSRCIKYRRILMRNHANGRLRNSTSDPGPAPAVA